MGLVHIYISEEARTIFKMLAAGTNMTMVEFLETLAKREHERFMQTMQRHVKREFEEEEEQGPD